MRKIPQVREVDQGLAQVRRAAKGAVKAINRAAGTVMAKGRYEEAQGLAERAKEALAFAGEVDELRKRWKHLMSRGARGRRSEKAATTPLWAYYQPVLQAILELGGAAPRSEIEPVVGRLMGDDLLPGDLEVMSRGWKRWQRQVFLTHRHLIQEGWIEDEGRRWAITSSGRKAAKSAPMKG